MSRLTTTSRPRPSCASSSRRSRSTCRRTASRTSSYAAPSPNFAAFVGTFTAVRPRSMVVNADGLVFESVSNVTERGHGAGRRPDLPALRAPDRERRHAGRGRDHEGQDLRPQGVPRPGAAASATPALRASRRASSGRRSSSATTAARTPRRRLRLTRHRLDPRCSCSRKDQAHRSPSGQPEHVVGDLGHLASGDGRVGAHPRVVLPVGRRPTSCATRRPPRRSRCGSETSRPCTRAMVSATWVDA